MCDTVCQAVIRFARSLALPRRGRGGGRAVRKGEMCFATWISLCFTSSCVSPQAVFHLMGCFSFSLQCVSLPGSHCVSLHGVFRHMGLIVTSSSLYIIGGHSCVFKMASYESLTDLL